MNRGFIQIPILIAIMVSAVVFGGGGYYIAHEISKPSLDSSDATATTTETISAEVEVGEESLKNTTPKNESGEASIQAKIDTSIKTGVATPKVETIKEATPIPAVAICRAEIGLSRLPPTSIDPAGMRTFFEYVVSSNPPISNLNSLEGLLLKVRNDYAFSDTSADYGSVSYTAEQLNATDVTQQQISTAYINYLNYWISVTSKIIADKKDNGCIDKNLDSVL